MMPSAGQPDSPDAGVSVEVTDHIATIEIRNPSRRNAIGVPIARRIVQICRDVEADPDVGGIIIQGAGGNFCSGGDRSELAAASADPLTNENMARVSAIYDAFVEFGTVGLPTVAAVRGAAVGAGLNLALSADVRIVADDARLLPGFIPNGFHPGGGHMLLLHRAAGPDASAAIGMLGAAVSGKDAARLGLAWASCPDADVQLKARELLSSIARDPDLARHAKRSYIAQTRSGSIDWRAALGVERVAQSWSFARAGRHASADPTASSSAE